MDAELFRPERWDENMPMNNNPTNAKWGYLPFQGGPRICLGSNYAIKSLRSAAWTDFRHTVDFALTEAAYTVFRILQRFPDITIPTGEKVELVGVEKQIITLVISIAEGCKVHIQ